MYDLLPAFLNDGVTWPEAVVTLGILMFAGFALVAAAALLIALLTD